MTIQGSFDCQLNLYLRSAKSYICKKSFSDTYEVQEF
jgi:hypothetical protein